MAYTFITRVILFGAGVAVSILLARLLGPSDRGKYAIVLLIPAILVKLGTGGTEVANVYFAASRAYRISEIVANSIFVAAVFGVVVIGVFAVTYFLPVFARYIRAKQIPGGLIWLAVSCVPLMIARQLLNRVLLGTGKVFFFNMIDVLQMGLQLVLILALLVALRWALRGAVFGFWLATSVTTGLIFLLVGRTEPIRLRFSWAVLRESLRYGSKAYLANLAQFLNYRLDTLIVSILLGTREVGYYAVAVGIAERLWMIPGSIGTVLFPKVSESTSSDATAYTLFSVKLALYLVTFMAMLMWPMSRWLVVFLYGTAYVFSATPLVVLLPGIVALSVGKVLTSDLAGRGRPEFAAVSSAASLVLTVVMDFLLIPKWGIVGAAVASSGSYSVATVIVVLYFLKVTGVRAGQLLIPTRQDMLNLTRLIGRALAR